VVRSVVNGDTVTQRKRRRSGEEVGLVMMRVEERERERERERGSDENGKATN